MCVAALAWHAHPRWRIVAIGNRDEFHDRPAAPLARWDTDDLGATGIIAGRDLTAGGTWLGVSEAGRFGLVTNLRGFGERAPDRASRGQLVTDMLTGIGDFGDPATADLSAFNPFNLLVADARTARFLTNRPAAAGAAARGDRWRRCPACRRTDHPRRQPRCQPLGMRFDSRARWRT